MPTVQFTISANDLARFVTAIVKTEPYQEQVQNEEGETIDNPETPQQYAKRHVREYVVTRTKNYEDREAEKDFVYPDPIVVTE